MDEIVLATRSAGKIRELVAMLGGAGLRALTLEELGLAATADEDGIEVFDTFEENAVAKARWFFARAEGRPVLADDSGICIDALGGAPGVRSKRWAAESGLTGRVLDDANNAKLVREVARAQDHRARYVCVAAVTTATAEHVARGECRGTIVVEPRGLGGFGYDPYFRSNELGVTFGEADESAKDLVSHRGRAVRAVLALLSEKSSGGR